MNIQGLLKTTLLDYPGCVAATVFMGGCNMRCPFCHNSELILNPPAEMQIPEEEVLAHLTKRRNVLSGLCITGGEPTLQPDLRDFIGKVRELGYKIKLDTNGLKPDTLAELLDAGMLDYVAMDIKAGRDNYAAVCGLGHNPDDKSFPDNISESARILISSGTDHEFRTTVVKGLHTESDFTDIREWMEELLCETGGETKVKNYFLQSYVYRDTVLDKEAEYDSFTKEELTGFMEILRPIADNIALRGVD